MDKTNKTWIWGDRKLVAKEVGISPQYLCDIMAGRKECLPSRALLLAEACKKYGYDVPALLWAFPATREHHPLFPPYK